MTMYCFLGIKVPLEKVKDLYRALKKEKKSVFKVYLCETETHSRTDCEPAEATLARCTGFLGMIRESFKPSEITTQLKEFEEFMQEMDKIVKKLKIPVTCGAEIYSGIAHRVHYYIDDLPDEKESDDENGGDAYYNVDVDA